MTAAGRSGGSNSAIMDLPAAAASSLPPRGFVRVKSQIQRAVRRMSGGGSNSSSSVCSNYSNTSPSPTPAETFLPLSSSPLQIEDGSGGGGGSSFTTRASVEKPGWGVRAAVLAAAANGQKFRSRHLSLNVDAPSRPPGTIETLTPPPGGAGGAGGTGGAGWVGGVGEGGGGVVQRGHAERRAERPLYKADSSPLPQKRRISAVEKVTAAESCRRASQPIGAAATAAAAKHHQEMDRAGDGGGGGARLLDAWPFSSAFTYGLGKATPFPCGSEAVMINSALALDAFQGKAVKDAQVSFLSHVHVMSAEAFVYCAPRPSQN